MTNNIPKITVLESEGELKRMIRKESSASCAKFLFILFKIKRKQAISYEVIDQEHELPQDVATHLLNEYRRIGLNPVLKSLKATEEFDPVDNSFTRYRQVLNMHLDKLQSYEEASAILTEHFGVELSFNEVYRLFINYYGLPLPQIKQMMKGNSESLLKRI